MSEFIARKRVATIARARYFRMTLGKDGGRIKDSKIGRLKNTVRGSYNTIVLLTISTENGKVEGYLI
ncbi:MAG TPA: hypothetical protein DEB10_07560 [Ruminococcaceae bacterium]|jgi:hypothetical protein|nr:hypothetical protein [Oscillospiraceae bacterium]HCA31171.1 hypothetical protein [Oscillospiraceae bacterium]